MTTSTKVWDITQPRDSVGRAFAKYDYEVNGLRQLAGQIYGTVIEVQTEAEAHYCDLRDYPEICEECFENHLEAKQQHDEDMYRDR